MIQRLCLMIFKYVEKLYQKEKYYLPKTQYCILETLTALFRTIFSDFSLQEHPPNLPFTFYLDLTSHSILHCSFFTWNQWVLKFILTYNLFSKDSIFLSKKKTPPLYQNNFVTNMIDFAHPFLYAFWTLDMKSSHVALFFPYCCYFRIKLVSSCSPILVFSKNLLNVEPQIFYSTQVKSSLFLTSNIVKLINWQIVFKKHFGKCMNLSISLQYQFYFW